MESLFVFFGISKENVRKILASSHPKLQNFKKNESIYSPDSFQRDIGFIYQGGCRIVRHRAKKDVPLRTLKPGDSFGVLTLFAECEEYPTQVLASSDCAVIFFPRSDVIEWIKASPDISINLMKFMCSRIQFLNTKIKAFSGKDIEAKTAAYLLSVCPEQGPFYPFCASEAAKAIGCGRASLYRALETFSKQKVISTNKKEICIRNKNELKRIQK